MSITAEESIGTLLHRVKQWCRDNRADYESVGRGNSRATGAPVSLWKVEVRLATGRRIRVAAATQAEVLAELERQRRKFRRGEIWPG